MVDFTECQDINAWYDPQQGKVTMCYGLIEHFSNVVFKAEGTGPGGGQTPPGGGTTPAGDPAVAFLIGGYWTTSFPVDGGMIEANVKYFDDMSYRVEMGTPYGPATTIGRWSEATRSSKRWMSLKRSVPRSQSRLAR